MKKRKKSQLAPMIFCALFHEIIKRSNEILLKEKIIDETQRLTLETPQTKLYGLNDDKPGNFISRVNPISKEKDAVRTEYKASIGYAMKLFIDHSKKYNKFIFNTRRLCDTNLAYTRLIKDGQTVKGIVCISQNYIDLYLDFTGFSNLHDLRTKSQFYHSLNEARGTTYETTYHMIGHYYSKDSNRLLQFRAVFIKNNDDKIPIVVKFSGADIYNPYEGQVEIRYNHREIVMHTWSNNTEIPRLLIVSIMQKLSIPFYEQKILVGNYLNAGKKALENDRGAIIFEPVKNDRTFSSLDLDYVQYYLMHPPNKISNGGYKEVEAFFNDAKINKAKLELSNWFNGKYFFAYLLCKKRLKPLGEREDMLEMSKFYFETPYRFTATSFTNKAVNSKFIGEVSFSPPNQVVLDMISEDNKANYHLVLDISGIKQDEPLRGVYSGTTQAGKIVAGRVLLKREKKTIFNTSEPSIFNLDSDIVNQLNKTLDLERFFSGQADNYLDNEEAFPAVAVKIFTGTGDLSNLAGAYYYYRTRTIRGHVREIKKFPMLLRPDGSLLVKGYPDQKEELAFGKAIRIENKVYIHLRKKDRYDGLAIVWPPSFGGVSPKDEIIPGLYVSTSKRFHVISGRIFFQRLFGDDDPQRIFDSLKPCNLIVDEEFNNNDLSGKEYRILKLLTGQLNNYMTIRAATELDTPNYGKAIFQGACFAMLEKRTEEAMNYLFYCLVRAGYKDISELAKAFSKKGAFEGQMNPFLIFVERNYDVFSHDDQVKYIKKLFQEINDFNSEK